MTIYNFTPLSRAWKACCAALRLAAIISIALCAMSCTTTQRATTSSSQTATTVTDSQSVGVAVHEMLRVSHQAIPADTAPLILPLESLHNLPEGVTVSHKKGRATAHAAVKNGQLHITATCDSLQQLVEHYALQAAAYAAEAQQQRSLHQAATQELRKKTSPLWYSLVPLWFIGLLTATSAVYLIFHSKIRKLCRIN